MNENFRLKILHTPPALAGDHAAGMERKRLQEIAAGSRRLDAETIERLRRDTWLGGDAWRRGGYMATSGLRDQAGHPELALLNVPSAFVPMAQQLLHEIGDYILDGGAHLETGEIFALADPRLAETVVTFARLAPGELPSPELGREVLVVVPLP